MITRARLLAAALVLAMPLGCRPRVPAGSADSNATAMGHWDEWRDLSPLVEIARHHAPQPAANAIDRANRRRAMLDQQRQYQREIVTDRRRERGASG